LFKDVLNIFKSILSVLLYFCKMGVYLLLIGYDIFDEKRNEFRRTEKSQKL